MKMIKLFPASLLLVMFALTFAGCGTLNKGGVYGGDKLLYDADLTIASSYELLHSFVLFESQNRDGMPGDVTKAADRIRLWSPQWFASALALRDAYKGNPSPANADALQKALTVLRAAVAEATGYLIAQQLTPPK